MQCLDYGYEVLVVGSVCFAVITGILPAVDPD